MIARVNNQSAWKSSPYLRDSVYLNCRCTGKCVFAIFLTIVYSFNISRLYINNYIIINFYHDVLCLAGLHVVRAGLRVPHLGQRVPDAQTGYQDVEKRPGPTGAGVQDVQSHQESHTPRAQGPVRREERLRCVVVRLWTPSPHGRRRRGLSSACQGPQVSLRTINSYYY